MKMMSLYDYLGHAAGSKLGLEVAEAARDMGIAPGKRFVKNPGYTGMIMTYPERFLKLYFQDQAVGEQLKLPF
jgi:hypothetical protein